MKTRHFFGTVMKTLFEQIADLPAGSKLEDYMLEDESGRFYCTNSVRIPLDSNVLMLRKIKKTKPHPYAALMMQYALDAQETETPWDRWQSRFHETWEDLNSNPSWHNSVEYRRKEQP